MPRQPRAPIVPLTGMSQGELAVEWTDPPVIWVGRSAAGIRQSLLTFGVQWEPIETGGAGVPGGGTITSIATTAPIAGGPITATGTITHANSGATAGTYQGLTLNASGHVTAATNMNYALQSALTALAARVTALESAGPTLTAPVITSSNTASATVGQSFSYTMSATGNPTPTLSVTGLPSWLTQAGHVISGTPPVGSDLTGATFTVHATNTQGSPTMVVTMTIAPATTGWTATRSHVSGSTFDNTNPIALGGFTGWNEANRHQWGSAPDYIYDPSFIAMTPFPFELYGKYTTDATELKLHFNGFGPGTSGIDKITEWGFNGTSIYIVGNNSTGAPIELRLVRL